MTNITPLDGAELLKRFFALPKIHKNVELTIAFPNDCRFTMAHEDACYALKLPVGETISQSSTKIEPGGLFFTIYAQRNLADKILGLAKGAIINARVKTIAGIGSEVCGLMEHNRMFLGLLIIDLI